MVKGYLQKREILARASQLDDISEEELEHLRILDFKSLTDHLDEERYSVTFEVEEKSRMELIACIILPLLLYGMLAWFPENPSNWYVHLHATMGGILSGMLGLSYWLKNLRYRIFIRKRR